jgi:hypothetical protein
MLAFPDHLKPQHSSLVGSFCTVLSATAAFRMAYPQLMQKEIARTVFASTSSLQRQKLDRSLKSYARAPKTSQKFRNIKTSTLTLSEDKTMLQTDKKMIPLRLELRTACVLDRSDNQLHHRTN